MLFEFIALYRFWSFEIQGLSSEENSLRCRQKIQTDKKQERPQRELKETNLRKHNKELDSSIGEKNKTKDKKIDKYVELKISRD